MDIQCNGPFRAKITSKWTTQGLETACSMPDHPRTPSVRIASGPDGTSAASSPSITQPDERTDYVHTPSDERSEQTPVGIGRQWVQTSSADVGASPIYSTNLGLDILPSVVYNMGHNSGHCPKCTFSLGGESVGLSFPTST